MPTQRPTRRQFLTGLAWGTAAVTWSCVAPSRRARAAALASSGCTLSIGTYSMKGVPLDEAVRTVGAIGYDGIEIAVMPGYGAEPASLPAERRAELRKLIADQKLKLTALMENLPPATDDKQHRADLDRLRRVLDLAQALGGDATPIVQTVLGGGKWEEKQSLFRDRLGDWQAAAEQAQVTIAIKPHRGGAMSRPSEAIWLIQQLGNSKRLRMVYDYSHYAFRDMPLAATIDEALPYTVHVAVKDAVQQNGKVVFDLPGASGAFDYVPLLKQFYDRGYRGDFCCEVSAMVSGKPDYDSRRAAQACYDNMSRAFNRSMVPRG